MNSFEKSIFFIILPTLALISYSPDILFSGISGIIIIAMVIAGMVLLGMALWRGRLIALTFSIFLQGLNVIIRIMMIFPFAQLRDGRIDIIYVSTITFGLLLSFYLMLFLDGQKVRSLKFS